MCVLYRATGFLGLPVADGCVAVAVDEEKWVFRDVEDEQLSRMSRAGLPLFFSFVSNVCPDAFSKIKHRRPILLQVF